MGGNIYTFIHQVIVSQSWGSTDRQKLGSEIYLNTLVDDVTNLYTKGMAGILMISWYIIYLFFMPQELQNGNGDNYVVQKQTQSP